MGNVWAFLLLIGPLIFIHELGHLIAAKIVDVPAPRFSLGFGPPLVRVKLGETEYCLAPIPLGGYVRLRGQDPFEEIPPELEHRALSRKPLWAKWLVLAAGPVANLVLPVAVFFFFYIGQTEIAPPVIGTVVDGSAAEAAELQPGDRIVSVNDRDIRSWRDLQDIVSDHPDEELRMQVERRNQRLERFVAPRRVVVRDGVGERDVGRLGVASYFYAPQIGVTGPQTPAYEVGLRTGDVITSVNGEPIQTVHELMRLLEGVHRTQLRITYLRPQTLAGPLGNYIHYTSKHAQVMPRGNEEGELGIVPAMTFVRSVDPGSPAARAGIRPGDRLRAVDGVEFTTWEYLAGVLAARRDEALALTVQTPGQTAREVSIRQEFKTWNNRYRQEMRTLWFGVRTYQKIHFPDPAPIRGRFTYAISSGVKDTVHAVVSTWRVLGQMLTRRRGLDELGGVVAMYNAAGTAADQGSGEFMLLMAGLSVNLAIFNLLPIPLLDGGHLLFFTIEAIRRRPVGQRAREYAAAAGLILIIILLLVAFRNDLYKYVLDS